MVLVPLFVGQCAFVCLSGVTSAPSDLLYSHLIELIFNSFLFANIIGAPALFRLFKFQVSNLIHIFLRLGHLYKESGHAGGPL